MPNVPIVDPHLLLWDPTRFKMPWLDTDYWTDEKSILGRPYGLAGLDQQRDGVEIEAVVCFEVGVAPAYGLLEARWLHGLGDIDPQVQGVVAWAPMEYGEQARAYLEAVRAIGPRVKGVRRVLELEPEDFCLQPGFVRAVRMLPELGFSFDLAIKRRQLASSIELVERCPDTTFILNHIGKPGIRDGVRDPWWDEIHDMAEHPNVSCKVSGAITEADFNAWTYDQIAPYLERVLEVFGEDRVMFAGDWPVVLLASSYGGWVQTAERLVSQLSARAQAKFWAGNARRIYRLGGQAGVTAEGGR
jgi:L-fuconolactonase